MNKNAKLIDPLLARSLSDYGIVKLASKRKSAEEAQDGVDSELKNEDSGSSVDDDGLFSADAALINPEGGHAISDGKTDGAGTPS
jgi:hypothetical protein